MKNTNPKYLHKEQIKRRRRRKWYYTVSVTLAAVVVFCTVYALILPAITLEKEQQTLNCPLNIHKHTAQCYDSDKTLMCGEADFVIHTHNESCFDEDGSLMCKIPEIEEHKHSDSCYNTEGELVCKLSEVEAHKHNDSCYDNNGTLTCGKFHTTEHIHGAACFNTSEMTNDMAVKNEMITLNDTAETANSTESDSWGYNEDGSIWWDGTLILKQVAIADIEENMPYIIAGNSRLNVLTNITGSDIMETNRPGLNNVSAYKSYEIWYFKKIKGSEEQYCIYTENGQYLRLQGQSLSLTSENEATAFTLKQATFNEYTHCVTIKSNGYYLNTFKGDTQSCTGWGGWNDDDAGSCLQILKPAEERQTANRVETVSFTNSVINLFDYWVSDNQNDPDNAAAGLENGINQGHAFKFVRGDQPKTESVNRWTGNGANPRQGIVQKELVNGYPALSGSYQGEETVSYESLEYLFNPAYQHQGKQSYRNVGGLLSTNNEGYYYFDCQTYAAEFNEESNSINVYDTPVVGGQFFPFNNAPEIITASREDVKLNHYFGVTITSRFIQQNGGHTDEKRTTPTTFYFSGDDDVWVFIDGVLVGDVGGIHDMASVSIDFSAGEVAVGVIGGSHPIKTTLKACYEAAGRADDTKWDGDTYKDGTVHTLKFFYLERGNYDSNMKLKYNLIEIPKTAIKKIDEYGKPVSGATFAVFAADTSYNILYEKDGTLVSLPSDKEIRYDEHRNIIDDSGNILAKALYSGTTDENGEMIFIDPDNKEYSINDLKHLFGNNFIVKEVVIPDDHRLVSSDIHLRIFDGTSQSIIMCDNTLYSGARAATDLQITATDTIHLRRAYKGEGKFKGKTAIQYCNPENGNTFGTLFAIVFKYTGNIDENGNATDDFSTGNCWTPVYGSDEAGYQLIDMSNGKSLLQASIEAANNAQDYGSVAFSKSTSGTMRLILDNLPGHITTYYGMLGNQQIEKTRYIVVYYWTDQSSIKDATVDNTYSVNSYPSTIDGVRYRGFERMFGAEIQIPNLINDVFVQKVNEKNELVNDATFALYQVQEVDGEIRYRAAATDGSISYTSLPQGATPDPNTGEIITGEGKSVKPLKTDVTKMYDKSHTAGTVRFVDLTVGQYIIKEINAPPGYALNTTDIMVLVTKDTIYANAGTEDDGIIVGRGPGYLVTPLVQFASEGQIDNTLSWIYAQMQISQESTSFADVGDKTKIMGYLKENNSCNVGTEAEAGRTYLKYDAANKGTAFNYVPNEDRTTENGAQNPLGTRRLFTTVGWPYYEIHQDYKYGSEKLKNSSTNYEDWSSSEVTQLFSRSTYIRVMDKQETTLKLKKVDESNKVLSGAKFRLYRLDSENKKEYYVRNNNNISWNTDINTAMVLTTDSDGMAESFTGLRNGEYYLEEVKAPDGYYKLKGPLKLRLEKATFTLNPEKPPDKQSAEIDGGVADEHRLYTYIVTVYNSTGFELPATGGNGTFMYTTGGILLITFSLVCGYRKKRRSGRRFK